MGAERARSVPRFEILVARGQNMALRAVATDSEVTLGLSEPILGGNEKAKEVFGFLQSKTFSKDREGFILGDVFADGVVRNGGFSEFSEKVNGRVAQIAFPLGLTQTFGEDGDFLGQLLRVPLTQVLVHVMDKETHKWIPTIIFYTCKVVAIAVAIHVQKLLSAFYSAVRGGLLVSRNVMYVLDRKGVFKLDPNETYVDEVTGWALAAVGFYCQFSGGFVVVCVRRRYAMVAVTVKKIVKVFVVGVGDDIRRCGRGGSRGAPIRRGLTQSDLAITLQGKQTFAVEKLCFA